MDHISRRTLSFILGITFTASCLAAQTTLTWEELKERFKKNNPNRLAGELSIEEAKANEITSGLRPNPIFTSTEDQNKLFSNNPYRPLGAIQWTEAFSQLIERRNKRQLRVESSRLSTQISKTDLADLERQLLFVLRDAFVRVLQGKSVVELATENLKYYDRVIEVNRERQKAGDIARIDLQRVELQRAQFEGDLVNAEVNLRTAKIALLATINERMPVGGFDVSGRFDYKPVVMTNDEVRADAAATRPDLMSAITAIEKAKADNRLAHANGSTDPTLIADYARAGPENTLGVGFSIPLRIFDRNQGEKARTAIEIQRTDKVRAGVEATIYRDVDSAYATIESVAALLKPYRERYLPQSEDVRETVSFSYSKGGASLLEFLDAQKSYRDIQMNYRNLLASYLTAINQLNLAIGKEAIQ